MSNHTELELAHPNGKWISGYFVEDGVLLGVDFSAQENSEYAQMATPYGFYVPPFVTKIAIEDDSFNLMGDIIDDWIMTDSVRFFDDSNFDMCGFRKFVIQDKDTGIVIFETDRFVDECQNDFLGCIPAFARFAKALNSDPDKFYARCKDSIPFFKTRKKESAPEPVAPNPESIYRRFATIECAKQPSPVRDCNGIIKKKIKVTDSETGRVYTVSYTTKEKAYTHGSWHYDLYDAAEHYIGGNSGDKVIDTEKATDIPYAQRSGYYKVWNNILAAVSDDDVLKEILAMAQKNARGELTKNRIVRIACDALVTEYGEIMQLIGKPKDEATLEVFQKPRQFNPDELLKIEQDYFALHPEMISK